MLRKQIPVATFRLALAIACVCFILSASVAQAAAPVTLRQGKAQIVSLPAAVADVMVADPNIVEVQAVQSNKLYVVGLAVGDTNVIALDAEGNTLNTLDVHVAMDTQTLQSSLDSLFPDEDVTVSAMGTQLILQGTVSSPGVANKVQSVVAYYLSGVFGEEFEALGDKATILLEVQGEQQVMLKVRLVEASRSIARNLGVQTFLNGMATEGGGFEFTEPGTGGQWAFGAPRGAPPGVLGQSLISRSSAPLDDPIVETSLALWTGADAFQYLGFTLKALETEGLVNILAEPNLTAVSGETAGFLAGGEFPVPVGRDREGNIIIEFKQFGVSLNFRPLVLSEDRISLQLKTEVSSLDFSNAEQAGDLTIPGLDVRKASTTVEVPSGATLMIAGILQSETLKNISGLPGVKNTPILGDLMSSDSFTRSETELVVMVTPYLVKPFGHKGLDAEATPEPAQAPALERAFLANVQKAFGPKALAKLTTEGGRYGYLVE
jgi:pilus assembly protein CpaC